MLKGPCSILALLALLTLPEIVAAQTLQVVDATGKAVGDVLGVSHDGELPGEASVAVEVSEGRFALLFFGSTSFRSFDFEPVYFTSSDCSGQAFVVPERGWTPFVPSVKVNDLLYFAQEGAVPQVIARNSYFYNGFCSEGPDETIGVMAAPPLDVGALFTAPFSVKATEKNGKGKPTKQ